MNGSVANDEETTQNASDHTKKAKEYCLPMCPSLLVINLEER